MPLPTGEPGDRGKGDKGKGDKGKGDKGKGDKEMSAGKMGEVGDMNKHRMDEAEVNFEKEKEVHPYGDILNLPYPPAGRREKVSLQERAAQFAPFAALTGYERVINETERRTQRRREPDEEEKSRLDRRLDVLENCLEDMPMVAFTCFQPDERKAGGAYVQIAGIVKKIDRASGYIVMQNGTMLTAGDIVDIEGEIFAFMEIEAGTNNNS